MKKKNEKKNSWWVKAKEQKEEDLALATTHALGFMKPDVNRFLGRATYIPNTYYDKIDDVKDVSRLEFEQEYYLSPINDEIDGLRKKIDGLTDTLREKNDKCAVLQTSLDMLNHTVRVDEVKRESAEKVADWAVKKLLIELIEKSDEIERLERKVKEIDVRKEKNHIADRLIGIIDKKDHMIRYLMKQLGMNRNE